MALERKHKLLSPPCGFKLIKYPEPIISAVKLISVAWDPDQLPQRGNGVVYAEDVTEAVWRGHHEGTRPGAVFYALHSAGPAGPELWTTGYNPRTDRGEHPPPRPAGEPHPGPQGAQTHAVAPLKWYLYHLSLSSSTLILKILITTDSSCSVESLECCVFQSWT